MKVISFINYKGGVGKTTITANIAAELARRGKKVLVIDLDPQANLTFSFIQVDMWRNNYQNDKTIKTWFDNFIDGDEILDLKKLIIKPTRANRFTNNQLDIICSHLGLINVDLELAVMLSGASPRQQRNNFLKVYSLLSKGIKDLGNMYDIVLIDCPPNFNIVTKNALVASDYFVVPAKLDYLSTLGIEQLNRHIKDLVTDYNNYVNQDENEDYKTLEPRLLGVIATMVSIRNNNLITAHKQYLSRLKTMGLPILNSTIRENKTVYGEAPEYGVPVVLNSSSQVSPRTVKNELKNLTDEFIRKVGLK